jgi:hypothetical protein
MEAENSRLPWELEMANPCRYKSKKEKEEEGGGEQGLRNALIFVLY